jgi:FMN phosphatase YigB (HAD superfamily)
MLKKFILTVSIFITSFLQAEIIEISQIDAVRLYVIENALCLFDIDDTLIDNPFSLGSPPWRNWVKSKIPNFSTNFAVYDALTLFIAKNAPYKTVEPSTAHLITELIDQGHAVLAFTSRGRTQWSTTDIEGVDRFTHEQLNHAGIDFKNAKIPEKLKALDDKYFNDGIIFASHIKKGDLFKHLFKDLNYTPPLILFVDDNLEQMQSVEAAAKEVGIPFIGFWYRRSAIDRKDFNPMVANIQLEALLLKGEIISDEAAKDLSQAGQNDDPEIYLKEIFEKIDIEQLTPTIPLPVY